MGGFGAAAGPQGAEKHRVSLRRGESWKARGAQAPPQDGPGPGRSRSQPESPSTLRPGPNPLEGLPTVDAACALGAPRAQVIGRRVDFGSGCGGSDSGRVDSGSGCDGWPGDRREGAPRLACDDRIADPSRTCNAAGPGRHLLMASGPKHPRWRHSHAGAAVAPAGQTPVKHRSNTSQTLVAPAAGPWLRQIIIGGSSGCGGVACQWWVARSAMAGRLWSPGRSGRPVTTRLPPVSSRPGP
jgi:hypothetical protein